MTISWDRVSANDTGSDDYLSYVQNKLYKVGEVEFSGAEDVTVGGIDGKRFIVTTEIAGVTFKNFIVYVVREGYVYLLSGTAMAEDFDSVSPDFEAYVSSLRFE